MAFNQIITNCGLLEFSCLGNSLSWRGRRNSKNVRCKFDRALANEDWHTIFTHSFVEYPGMIGSDHRPIMATIKNKVPRRKNSSVLINIGLVERALWNR